MHHQSTRTQQPVRSCHDAQVFKLMEPHGRYTIPIGANSRLQFLAPTTEVETTFTTGAVLWFPVSPSYGML